MVTTIKQVLDQAVALSPADRAQLVEAILASFSPSDPEVDHAWRREAEDRLAAWREGRLEDESVADVMERISRGRLCDSLT